ncbi:hypothetical protein SLEP1_g29282 [Rubroshorea leprosula]|uniref:Kinetochore protein SPC25 n=1 Tax=Rubroshorea leprosula TaxID=152421 RepID=A0AAV5K4X8_9ROSI|nr:hypothetical protein SLEP1_g29282 [Rubroshorea leprosula]
MHSQTEESVRNKMESLRLISDGEIPMQQQKMDAFAASFETSLDSVNARAKENAENQAKLANMKANLREAEDKLVKVLAVKTRKEAQQMATRESISAAKARIEELKRTVQIQTARRDEHAAIISQQSLALAISEEKGKQDFEHRGEIQEAISWYNCVLGFHIEGGQGVKFTFNNINTQNPKEEYSFSIRHANDTYTLLDCDPHVNGIKDLIHDLNRTNGLFKFVIIMRQKFQEAAAHGLLPQSTSLCQESSTISLSAPVFSVSTETSESPAMRDDHQGQLGEVNRLCKEVYPISESLDKMNDNQISDGKVNSHYKKVNRGRGTKSSILSPESVTPRRSTRLKVRK